MSKTVGVADMAKAITSVMADFAGALQEDVESAAKETAKTVAEDINATAKTLFPPDGPYASSWKSAKRPGKNKLGVSYVVYSTSYRIAHLLEKGHAKVNGGTVDGQPHILPAADRGERRFITDIKNRIEGRQ